jgi:hypothetical protein
MRRFPAEDDDDDDDEGCTASPVDLDLDEPPAPGLESVGYGRAARPLLCNTGMRS